MKKWMYVIFPGTALVLFIFVYLGEVKKMDEKEQAKAVEVAQAKKADDDRKARLQQEAGENAAKKAKEREDERLRKEAEKAAKWKADSDKIQEYTDKAKADIAARSKQIADLELQLDKVRAQRDQTNREYLDLVKTVELTKIERRNAELEIQRMTQKIANRATDSSLTKMPAPIVQVTPAR